MSSKNKRVPKRYCDKDYRVGQRVRANLTHTKRIIEGEIIKKVRIKLFGSARSIFV